MLAHTTLSRTGSHATSDLTAARLGALAVSLPKTLHIADLRCVIGVIAKRQTGNTFGNFVAVSVASRANAAETSLGASFGDFPAIAAADHD